MHGSLLRLLLLSILLGELMVSACNTGSKNPCSGPLCVFLGCLEVGQGHLRKPVVKLAGHELLGIHWIHRLGEPASRHGWRPSMPTLPICSTESFQIISNARCLERSAINTHHFPTGATEKGQGHAQGHGQIKQALLKRTQSVQRDVLDTSPFKRPP